MAYTFQGRSIRKVGVIGSGQIGPDIALYFTKVLAPMGVPVVVVDVAQDALDKGQAKIHKKIDKGVEAGAFKPDQAAAMKANLSWTTDYNTLSDADFVIEAATESEAIKHKIVAQLEAICPKDALLCCNSSHMEPEVVYAKLADKSRCAINHYFYPAERNIVVEIVPHAETSPAVTRWLMDFYEAIGKCPIKVKSRYGYAIDPIFEGLLLAGLEMVDRGEATVKEVDAVAMKVLGLGVGPFVAHNLTGGNPITAHGLADLHTRVNKWFRCPPSLKEKGDLTTKGDKAGNWDTAGRGEVVEVEPGKATMIGERLLGAYFGLCGEIVDAGLIDIGEFDLGLSTALVIKPPFATMNAMGVDKALALIEAYAKTTEHFPIPKCVKDQAATGKPFTVPVVFREDVDKIAVVKIKRPAVLNALNDAVCEQLDTMFQAIAHDGNVEGAVLTGFGVKAFVSGADINELAALLREADPHQATIEKCRRMQQPLLAMENLGKPVVAALNGLAFGGGSELAMACTARLAVEGMKPCMGQPEPNLGIIPGAGGTQRLPRIVGFDNAWPLLRNAKPIDAKKANEIGWVDELVPRDELMPRAIQHARDLFQGKAAARPKPMTALEPTAPGEMDLGHLSKQTDRILIAATTEGARTTLAEGLDIEFKYFADAVTSEDGKIGLENFIKNGPKSKAEFKHV